LLFASHLFYLTVETKSVMTADEFAAIRAFPRFFLFFQKHLHPVFLDESRIVYHAHFVAGFVSCVETFQAVTWEIRAFKAEIHSALQQSVTRFLHESTLLISRPTTCAIRHFDAFTFQVVHPCQVAGAKRTVHSARRN
jgi:hypothetical protein